jgi:hypothetical protein
MGERVHVVLALQANAPLWDLPAGLQAGVPDTRVVQAVPPESYLRRAKDGRNIYRDLPVFAQAMGIRVTVDVSNNDLLHQIQAIFPRAYEEL